MTDQYNALIVVLEKDIREDDAEDLIKALGKFKGVIKVKGNITDIESFAAEERARHNIWDKIFNVFKEDQEK
jgi:hypothetical protein